MGRGSLGVGRASSSKSWLCRFDVGVAIDEGGLQEVWREAEERGAGVKGRRVEREVDEGVDGREGVTITGRLAFLAPLSLLLLLLLSLAALPERGNTFRDSCFELRIFFMSCARSGRSSGEGDEEGAVGMRYEVCSLEDVQWL